MLAYYVLCFRITIYLGALSVLFFFLWLPSFLLYWNPQFILYSLGERNVDYCQYFAIPNNTIRKTLYQYHSMLVYFFGGYISRSGIAGSGCLSSWSPWEGGVCRRNPIWSLNGERQHRHLEVPPATAGLNPQGVHGPGEMRFFPTAQVRKCCTVRGLGGGWPGELDHWAFLRAKPRELFSHVKRIVCRYWLKWGWATCWSFKNCSRVS